MKFEFKSGEHRYACDMEAGVSLARPISFSDAQPNSWSVPAASKNSVLTDDFTGSTQAGGPCNVDQLSLVPHCHGTHTETIGHIVNAGFFVSEILLPLAMPAVVISVSPLAASSVDETYQPSLNATDQVVSSGLLAAELKRHDGFAPKALVIRTGADDAFFTNEAMAAIVELGVEHLLVDLPSVDRLNDDGLLSNHRIFWDVAPGSQAARSASRIGSTITELIRVPDQVNDGPCLLSIQVPAIESDAAPSRPVIYPVTRA